MLIIRKGDTVTIKAVVTISGNSVVQLQVANNPPFTVATDLIIEVEETHPVVGDLVSHANYSENGVLLLVYEDWAFVAFPGWSPRCVKYDSLRTAL